MRLDADPSARVSNYQSEAQLERHLIDQLVSQGYEYPTIHTEDDLVTNLRRENENLNGLAFTDEDWDRLFTTELDNKRDDIVEKTARIQHSPVIDFTLSNGTLVNVTLLDRAHIHRNHVQIINQY